MADTRLPAYAITLFSVLQFQNLLTNTPINEHIITLSVREYPNFKAIPEKITQKILQATKKQTPGLSPAELAELELRLLLKKHTPPSANVDLFATCTGFLSKTDQFGKIILPRTTQTHNLDILISPGVYPKFSANGNIAYWLLTSDAPATAFSIAKKLDPTNEQYYWETKLAPVPYDEPIPLHTLIIIADPADLYLPEDLTPTTNINQLILPDIYIKSPTNIKLKHNLIENNLATLNIRPFFAPIKKIYQATPYGIASQITT